MSANWKEAKEDLDLILNQGENVKGRTELRDSFVQGNYDSIDAVTQAYRIAQRDNHKLANLSRCIHEDPKRLYNMGRKLIGLKSA